MTDASLGEAAQSLREASDAASDDAVADRLTDQAEQFDRLAEDAGGVDHGKLARHEHVLREVKAAGEGPVVEHVDEALAAIKSFRSTLEGV